MKLQKIHTQISFNRLPERGGMSDAVQERQEDCGIIMENFIEK